MRLDGVPLCFSISALSAFNSSATRFQATVPVFGSRHVILSPLVNSNTAASLRKFKDAGNNYIWQWDTAKGEPETLLGYPVEIDENMPDVAVNAIPIIFGNFKLLRDITHSIYTA